MRPNDDEQHTFSHYADGDRPRESRLVCSCGWRSESRPEIELDLDVHIAEVNGIAYEEQKQRTTKALRDLGVAYPEYKPPN